MMHVFDTKCEALKKTIIFNLDIKTIFLSMIINFTHFIKSLLKAASFFAQHICIRVM